MQRSLWVGAVLCAVVGCAKPVEFRDSMPPVSGGLPTRDMMQVDPPPEPEPEVHEAVVTLEADTNVSGLPADTPSSFVARLRIRPEPLEGVPKPPVSVALVLDASGSMEGEALDKAKTAALDFVDALDDTDRVSLVVFHSATETLVPLRTLGDGGREQVREAVGMLQANGTTDLAGGLAAGFAQVRQALGQGGGTRVVLLSDGRPNNAQSIFPSVDQAAREGITVTALGLGLEYDEDLLGRIAQRTGGKFHFAESPDQVAALFRQEVLALQRIVAQHANLVVVPGPGMKIRRVLGPSQRSGTGFMMQIGDLVEQRERDVYVLLESEGHRAGARVEVLDAHLSYYDPLSKKGKTQRTFLGSRALEEGSPTSDAQIDLATARALAADDALAAMALARGGNLRAAKKRLVSALERAKKDAKRFDDDELRDKVDELLALKKALPSLVPPRPSRPRMRGAAVGRVMAPMEVAPAPRVGGAATKRSHASSMAELGY